MKMLEPRDPKKSQGFLNTRTEQDKEYYGSYLGSELEGNMPIPNRTRNKDGTFHKKRSDAGEPRYTRILLEAESPEKIEKVLADFRSEGIKYKEVQPQDINNNKLI